MTPPNSTMDALVAAAIKVADPAAFDDATGDLTSQLNGLGITTNDEVEVAVNVSNIVIAGTNLDNTASLAAHGDDEGGVEVKTSATGGYKNAAGANSKAYSPGSYGSGFIRHGAESRDNDPFSSPKKVHKYGSGKASATTSPTKRFDLNWRSGSSGNAGSDIYLPGPISTGPISAAHGHNPAISGQNAQAFYLPSACVFVANLLQGEDEIELEYGVTKIFSEFGPVFVKIRRDSKNMPFAFCQYTVDEDAARAIIEGRGRIIHGRPCRTEKARANRAYYMSRKDGARFSQAEGIRAAKAYGSIKDFWALDSSEEVITGLQGLVPGFFVEFKFYENGRDAELGMRDASSKYEMKTPHLDGVAHPRRANMSRIDPRSNRLRNFLSEYAIDRDSIFVGNLPGHLATEQVRDIFTACGDIIDVKVHHMPSTRLGCDVNCFAFIQFGSPIAVRKAIDAKDGFDMGHGHTLRVKQKDSTRSSTMKTRRSVEDDGAEVSHRECYQPPTSGGTGAATMQSSPPVQVHHYSYASYPPTPVSGGYPTGYGHHSYSPQWSMSPMHPGSSPADAYYPGYYQYPAYPSYQYQYQYPVDYSVQTPQTYSPQAGYGYSYPPPFAHYSTNNGVAETPTTPTPASHEDGHTGAEHVPETQN